MLTMASGRIFRVSAVALSLWAASPALAADVEFLAGGAYELDGEAVPAASKGPAQRSLEGQLAELNGRYIDLIVVKQDAASVLQAVAEQAKVQVTLAKGLTGQIENMRLNGPLRMCMDQIAERLGAVWWWNGRDLKLASRRDSVTRTVKSKHANEFIAAAKQFGIPVNVLSIQRAEGMGMVRVSGPTALVTDLETLAKDVDTQLSNVKLMKYGRASGATVR